MEEQSAAHLFCIPSGKLHTCSFTRKKKIKIKEIKVPDENQKILLGDIEDSKAL